MKRYEVGFSVNTKRIVFGLDLNTSGGDLNNGKLVGFSLFLVVAFFAGLYLMGGE